jgi:hypothetical protein
MTMIAKKCLLILVVCLFFGLADSAAAQFKIKPNLKPVGERASELGTILVYNPIEKTWVLSDKTLYANYPLTALPGVTGKAALADGKVLLLLEGNLPGATPSAALESRAVPHVAETADAEVTLQRGRIRLVNPGKTGPATVAVQFLEQTWTLTLAPGSEAVLERNAVWPTGSPLPAKPDPKNVPVNLMFVLAGRGSVGLDTGKKKYKLDEQMIYQWNSEGVQEAPPTKLPNQVDFRPKMNDDIQKVLIAMNGLTAGLVKGVGQQQFAPGAVQARLASADKGERLAGVLAASAIDEPALILQGLTSSKYSDLRNASVMVLRHWVSQGDDYPARLAKVLESQQINKASTDTFLRLLTGFSSQEASRLETYELLVSYLDHSELSIRHLAGWHLYKLMPEGATIKYDPTAGNLERRQAQTAWLEFLRKKSEKKND